MMLLSTAIFFLAASAPAQIVGGDWPLYHKEHGTQAAALFGNCVANAGDINGDGIEDAIVGAHGARTAYVFSGYNGALLYQISEPNNQGFGRSVSGAGDVNADGFGDFLIGAPTINTAYVYSGATGSLLYQWNPTATFEFGYSVCKAGDVNADGFADVIIGAPYANIGGSAYIYSGIDGSLLYQWDATDSASRFGISVSIAGDLNADGYTDVIVGDDWATTSGLIKRGAAYIYSGIDGSLMDQMYGPASYRYLGQSVANAGDVNADGTEDLIFGAYHRAYVVSGAAGTLLYELTGPGGYDYNFGISVSGAGDMDGDGFEDLIVGDNGFDYLDPYPGSALAFSGRDGSPMHIWESHHSDQNFFGNSVAGAGDVNGDGRADVLVGAPKLKRGVGSSAGGAYVFGFNPILAISATTISASSGGTISFDLNFPKSAALYEYKILMSAAGTQTTHVGIDIPLKHDRFTYDAFMDIYPVPSWNNMHGTLDNFGRASGSLTMPAGFAASVIGRTYYFAAIANPPNRLPRHSSVAVNLQIVP